MQLKLLMQYVKRQTILYFLVSLYLIIRFHRIKTEKFYLVLICYITQLKNLKATNKKVSLSKLLIG